MSSDFMFMSNILEFLPLYASPSGIEVIKCRNQNIAVVHNRCIRLIIYGKYALNMSSGFPLNSLNDQKNGLILLYVKVLCM